MLKKILRWLEERKSTSNTMPQQDLHRTAAHARPRIERSSNGRRRSDSSKPLIHKESERKDPDEQDALELLDEAAAESGEAKGIDPYNTGGFDRSKNWDSHFRK